ncbi:MAG: hypothetical protein IJ157_03280 [Clostridia bacterium]|nr:hypothetical protein [Clostridia bacterium]
MKMAKYMVSGALMGYAVGCRMESTRKYMLRAVKRAKRMLSRKLGL